MDRVSIELTTQMLATLFDWPFEDCRQLTYWSDLAVATPELTGGTATKGHRRAETTKFSECVMGMWHERAALPPKFDSISMLAHGEDTKDTIDRPMEFLGTLSLLLVGANDTTRNPLSAGVLALNRYPDEYRKLRENPALIPNMVSEMIRWHTPVSHMRRTATIDTEFEGHTMKKGEKVAMWYVAGNRDPRAFENPDEFTIERPDVRKHLSFGAGIHRCMGNRLAEMQLRIMWEEAMLRFEKIELVGDPSDCTPGDDLFKGRFQECFQITIDANAAARCEHMQVSLDYAGCRERVPRLQGRHCKLQEQGELGRTCLASDADSWRRRSNWPLGQTCLSHPDREPCPA